jgi:hypothetical protein
MSHLWPRSFRWLASTILLLALGCGHASYEQRLERTRRFYSYLAMLDQNLSRTVWKRPDREMSMRVPLPFGTPLPAPPPPTKDDNGNLISEPDNRHPLVLGIELDGLVEGWQATMPTSEGGQSPALLYVVTNQDRFLVNGARPPDQFLTDLETALATAFQVGIPEGESTNPQPNVRYRQIVPAANSMAAAYTQRKDFTAIEFVPTGPVGGRQLQALLYQFESGQIQGGVLCICPEATTQVRERMLMALQTLKIPSRAPSSGA